MVYESNCHRWEATCFCRSTYCIYRDISLLKTKNINTKIYISLEQLRMINMQRTSAIGSFVVLSKCGFHYHHCQSQPQSFFILTTCFFGGILANFDINEFTIAPEKSRKIGRAPYGVRLISYIGRCYHIRRRPAPVRYVTTQEIILKNGPVPGRLSNSPMMCTSVKSYDVSFICDHSIIP